MGVYYHDPISGCGSAVSLYVTENTYVRFAARPGSMRGFIRIPEMLCGLFV
jgi:hypothetical protein